MTQIEHFERKGNRIDSLDVQRMESILEVNLHHCSKSHY